MSTKQKHRADANVRREPNFARFALLSLVLHLATALFFSGVLKPRPVLEHRPVYFVDLSKMPVANPRAGRPDGAEKPDGKPAAPKPAATAAPKAAAPPQNVPPQKPAVSKPEKPASKAHPDKAVAAPKPKAEKATAATAKTGKTASEKPKPTAQKTAGNSKADVEKSYQETLGAIQALQAKAEREAIKERLAALASMDTRNTGGSGGTGGRNAGGTGEVPLGMPDGTGNEAGVSQELWLQTFLKQNWSFSKYQASRRDLEATTRIIYGADGKLISYEFLKKSGDSNFDDSVTKAILKEKQLPFSPKRQVNVEVVFNLKDLMD
ncbi:MAG: TonB C-terminal domain-containing protein [Syntrophotaleaceae bacterium]